MSNNTRNTNTTAAFIGGPHHGKHVVDEEFLAPVMIFSDEGGFHYYSRRFMNALFFDFTGTKLTKPSNDSNA